jgi:hypothetical protein
MKNVAGRTDIEDALRRLNELVPEESRMETAQIPKATHGVGNEGEADDDDLNDRAGSRVIGVEEGPVVIVECAHIVFNWPFIQNPERVPASCQGYKRGSRTDDEGNK